MTFVFACWGPFAEAFFVGLVWGAGEMKDFSSRITTFEVFRRMKRLYDETKLKDVLALIIFVRTQIIGYVCLWNGNMETCRTWAIISPLAAVVQWPAFSGTKFWKWFYMPRSHPIPTPKRLAQRHLYLTTVFELFSDQQTNVKYVKNCICWLRRLIDSFVAA